MCNQAIMIVTDGISANLSDTINKYIDLYNGSMPRLFTYLIGKEVTNVPEIKWIACANRGLLIIAKYDVHFLIETYFRLLFPCAEFRASDSVRREVYQRYCPSPGLTA